MPTKPKRSKFYFNSISHNSNSQPIIYMTEVIENGREKHGQFHSEERSETVQSMSKSSSESRNDNLRGVPEKNTSRSSGRRENLQRIPTNG